MKSKLEILEINKMKTKVNNVFCKGDGFKMIIVCVISLTIGFSSTFYLETDKPDSIPTMTTLASKDTTNLVLHLPIIRIGSGIR